MIIPKPIITLLAFVVVSGCLYDRDDICGPGEIFNHDNFACVCAENHVPNQRDITIVVSSNPTAAPPRAGCRPCGMNSHAENTECKCNDGFVQNGDDCVPSNLGASCASDADCASGEHTYCRLPEGYCTTSGCTSNANCPIESDFACVDDTAEPYCRRPPQGQGASCTQMGPDPACDPESPFCALGTCHTSGCTSDDDCSPSRTCCDLSAVSGQPGLTLCIAGECP